MSVPCPPISGPTDDAIAAEPQGATALNPDELEGLKYRHITMRGQLDELEQVNIESGLLWLGRRRKTDILTEQFIRELHRRLFGDVWKWAGQFRRTEKNIGIDPLEIGVQLRLLQDDARYWADHGTFPPLEAAARFHHRLVQIHPFPNGNGGMAGLPPTPTSPTVSAWMQSTGRQGTTFSGQATGAMPISPPCGRRMPATMDRCSILSERRNRRDGWPKGQRGESRVSPLDLGSNPLLRALILPPVSGRA